MTHQLLSQPDAAKGQYPLSFTQQSFHSLDVLAPPDREWRQPAGIVS